MAVRQNQSHAFLTGFQCSLSILSIVGAMGLGTSIVAQEEPLTEQGYEHEELGANQPRQLRETAGDIRPCLKWQAG